MHYLLYAQFACRWARITREGRKQPATLLLDLQTTPAQLRRLTVQQSRLNFARHDTRDCVQERRNRTRQLIELGGLVREAGLVELLDDDRAILSEALLDVAGRLQQHEDGRQDEKPADLKARRRRRGLRAFNTNNVAAAE